MTKEIKINDAAAEIERRERGLVQSVAKRDLSERDYQEERAQRGIRCSDAIAMMNWHPMCVFESLSREKSCSERAH